MMLNKGRIWADNGYSLLPSTQHSQLLLLLLYFFFGPIVYHALHRHYPKSTMLQMPHEYLLVKISTGP